MTTTLCFINQKGGCGKSSTCFHLAGCLAELGFEVLLVDADPQGSLSQAFFGSAEIERLTAEETLAALFDDGCHQVSADAITLPIRSSLAIRRLRMRQNALWTSRPRMAPKRKPKSVRTRSLLPVGS